MNDYGADWPLWAGHGGTAESEWSLAPELTTRLKSWAGTFHEHFHHEHGWDDQATCRAHRDEARQLHHLLQRELGPNYEVTVHLWEVNDCGEAWAEP